MADLKSLPILEFTSDKTFETWLKKHHGQSTGIWLKIYKKDSGKKTVTYAQALDVALCYGWIDAQKQAFDAESWLQKFCRRREKSIWSKINIGHVQRLVDAGRMKPAGMEAVEKAKADGTWDNAYDGQRNMAIPEEFLKELKKNKEAAKFFKSLNKTNLFAIGFRLQTAKKQETRDNRIKQIIEKLAKGEKFH